ncbi:MAG: N-acetylmuramoyl-L-alanine amidase [Ruminococcaceae bacterium]|nr:N-acetylmuramoyl-L-alanine amidase [Oscillospiraceae bacterium]
MNREYRKGKVARRLTVFLAGSLACLLLCGCDYSWRDLWSRDNPKPNDGLVVEKEDGEGEGDVIFQGAVEYTGSPHSGTDIYYIGKGDRKNYIIVIDPGHQLRANTDLEPIGPGSDITKMKVAGGAQSAAGLNEYDLNLSVSLMLRDILIQRGYSVVMTRETNEVDISNAERAQIANKYNAAVFIRVHANSNTDTSIRGVQVLCQSPDNPFPCNKTYAESRLLSELMLDEYCSATDLRRLSIIEDDTMAGINFSNVPTAIVEMGFLSNEAESRSMETAFFRRNAAEGMANGIDAFISEIAEESEADTSNADTPSSAIDKIAE